MRRREMTGNQTGAHLSDLFIVFVEGLGVSPVEESGDAYNFFLLVDYRQ